MKIIWSFEKIEDGTLCITDYKGEDYDIVIPEYIGEDKVSGIAAYAFSPQKPRSRKEQRWFLEHICSITIPDSVMSIDEGLRKAVTFLKDIIIEEEKPTTMAWA